ncbi:2-phospho-L-lactate guanylyltransferase [Arthrobacter sp. Soil736]|uniref:2-phospho-L-lactate guanylyltransferase n=1 Tax=Arthrobacter sp. Soil736 TaxID=1736395 RepID=UPI00138F0E92|nr:2-phospho-L-lactate guanylyltransferase [Arthrobacter sp. Soil736]
MPFKGGPSAKSRLQGHSGTGKIGPALRHELALGFLRDTVTAAAAAASVRRIIIVSSDPAAVMNGPKILMLADPGQGLNAAVDAGFAFARSLTSGIPVAAITADLPSLAAADLEYALEYAKHHPLTIVQDRAGTGTTMISARPGVRVHPLFGHRSRDAHLAACHILSPIPHRSTLRADVDTLDDLAAAVRIGVGDNTRAALIASGLLSPHPTLDADRPLSRSSENPIVQRKSSCPVF